MVLIGMEDQLPTLKVVLIGDTDIGKTSLVRRYCRGEFTDAFRTTIGAEFEYKTVTLENGQKVKVMLWDTAGQERSRSLSNYCRGAHGVMAVYSITRKDSLETIESRMKYYKEEGFPSDTRFILVGTKCDLESQREVSTEEGKEYANKHGYLFIETSAKDSTNVDTAFNMLISACHQEEPEPSDPSDDFMVYITALCASFAGPCLCQ